MNFIDSIKERAKNNIKTIVLPESMDERVLRAAVRATDEGLARVVVIGDIEEIKKFNIEGTERIEVINPSTYSDTENMVNELYILRKDKGLTYDEATNLLHNDYMYFACMLVKENLADGVVSGACHSSANTLRPALQIIKAKEDCDLVSAFFLMVVPNCEYGNNGIFIFSDCGLNPKPTSEELSEIAISSSESYQQIVGDAPKIAMLSYSTHGSAASEDVDKVREATQLTKEKAPNLLVDGELQLDSAIVPEIGNVKAPGSDVAGKANILIFPDLNSGNIGYKLVERLAKAEAYGPICQGMAKPVNDLSRGCKAKDIVGVVAITALQAQ